MLYFFCSTTDVPFVCRIWTVQLGRHIEHKYKYDVGLHAFCGLDVRGEGIGFGRWPYLLERSLLVAGCETFGGLLTNGTVPPNPHNTANVVRYTE